MAFIRDFLNVVVSLIASVRPEEARRSTFVSTLLGGMFTGSFNFCNPASCANRSPDCWFRTGTMMLICIWVEKCFKHTADPKRETAGRKHVLALWGLGNRGSPVCRITTLSWCLFLCSFILLIVLCSRLLAVICDHDCLRSSGFMIICRYLLSWLFTILCGHDYLLSSVFMIVCCHLCSLLSAVIVFMVVCSHLCSRFFSHMCLLLSAIICIHDCLQLSVFMIVCSHCVHDCLRSFVFITVCCYTVFMVVCNHFVHYRLQSSMFMILYSHMCLLLSAVTCVHDCL